MVSHTRWPRSIRFLRAIMLRRSSVCVVNRITSAIKGPFLVIAYKSIPWKLGQGFFNTQQRRTVANTLFFICSDWNSTIMNTLTTIFVREELSPVLLRLLALISLCVVSIRLDNIDFYISKRLKSFCCFGRKISIGYRGQRIKRWLRTVYLRWM